MNLPAGREIVRYEEPLAPDELSFLVRKESRDRAQMYRVARVFLFLCFICSFFVACVRAMLGADDPFNYRDYFLGVGFLIAFSGMGLYMGYTRFLRQTQRDIRRGTKTIERSYIQRKVYMPENNSYYFYIDSPNRLSIEVNDQDYHRLDIGDEVNIEYTTVSRMYLGYF